MAWLGWPPFTRGSDGRPFNAAGTCNRRWSGKVEALREAQGAVWLGEAPCSPGRKTIFRNLHFCSPNRFEFASAPMSDTKIPTTDNPSNLILIAGATGYVGDRLLHALESSGHRVRCLARH